MTVRTPTSANVRTDSARLQMEQSIDQLAERARQGVEPSSFFSEILDCALRAGGARQALLWCRTHEGKWRMAGEVPAAAPRDDDFLQRRQETLNKASQSAGPLQLRVTLAADESKSNHPAEDGTQILSPIRHASMTIGILETVHDMSSSGALPPDTFAFFTALCEITADYLSQQELEQLRRARATWQQWDQFSQSLWNSLDLASVCSVIANDGRILAESDRVSVLVRNAKRFQLQSVSGVASVDPRASVTRSLEGLAELAARDCRTVWYRPADTQGPNPAQNDLRAMLEQSLNDSGATGIGIVPVLAKSAEPNRRQADAMIVVERFHAMDDFAAWQSRGEALAGRCGPVLNAAIEQSRIPWLELWNILRTLPDFWLSPTAMIALAGCTFALLILALVPAEFTVSGFAELQPARRRDLFATTTGIVDRILTTHGDDVRKDQPLIILRDPQLETDAPRIAGEIATLNERLKGVQAARIIGNNAPDAGTRARQLTADEEEIRERLRTLERQRVLIEERLNRLTLSSPIDGKVLTWDVDHLLSARPVERGQTLLTVGDTSGPWVLEIRVADRDAGHLLKARNLRSDDIEVDFLLPSEPGKTYHGKISEISLSSESDDGTHSHIRVVVAFDRRQMEQPRAGATAIPRIHCGRKSLGYVWLHDLIDTIRTRILF